MNNSPKFDSYFMCCVYYWQNKICAKQDLFVYLLVLNRLRHYWTYINEIWYITRSNPYGHIG